MKNLMEGNTPKDTFATTVQLLANRRDSSDKRRPTVEVASLISEAFKPNCSTIVNDIALEILFSATPSAAKNTFPSKLIFGTALVPGRTSNCGGVVTTPKTSMSAIDVDASAALKVLATVSPLVGNFSTEMPRTSASVVGTTTSYSTFTVEPCKARGGALKLASAASSSKRRAVVTLVMLTMLSVTPSVVSAMVFCKACTTSTS
mmetsp:Transcript_133402/g.386133  ORF Transcript_133402/g.386133 Transcript_133402/m.386133 type:complete len:204 (-) Transcript_133402:1859-2470(-)